MAGALLRTAQEADHIAAGLQLFLDHIPRRETDIDGCIQELLALSSAFKELERDFPDYNTIPRITKDVELNVMSLHYTFRNVRIMFGETKSEKYSGQRPWRRAWEELDYHLVEKEGGPSLLSRLETYSIFLQCILGSLKRERLDPAEIIRNRQRISRLLAKQEPREESFSGVSYSQPGGTTSGASFSPPTEWPPRRPTLPHIHTFPPFRVPPSMAGWSDGSDEGPLPPAPDPPNPWSPQSPTLSTASYSSGHTWNSTSSPTRPQQQLSHWAPKVFDGRHGSTHFTTYGEHTVCYGRLETPGCVDRLIAEQFIEVLRLPLDAAKVYVRIYWRPSDHRARILMTAKDTSGIALRYCIPLTALKLIRKGPCIHLYRWSRENEELELWANLHFTVYEQLVLFYCAFAAMKSQDWQQSLDILQDRYHKATRSEEKEEFSGEIKDDNYLHALRIYRDKDSGGIRLEARARRGQFTATPIWTAFITDNVDSNTWIRRMGQKVLQLSNLHPYVFCHGYSPPRSKSGKFRLQFTSSKDADDFMLMVNELAALR